MIAARDAMEAFSLSEEAEPMKIAMIQTSPTNGRVTENLKDAAALAANVDADLVVFPELFATGYLHASKEVAASLADDGSGETIAWAKALSKQLDAAICGGFIWKNGELIQNAAFLVDGDEVLDLYAKIHLFDREKVPFDQGEAPTRVVECRGARVGMMICYDWQFPEVARCLGLDGAQILLHPSNLVLPWAQDAMRTRCLENGVFAVTCNRVGSEQDLTFTGQSQITGRKGEVLARSPETGTDVQIVDIDPTHADDKQLTPNNHRFTDRRPELYGRVTRTS